MRIFLFTILCNFVIFSSINSQSCLPGDITFNTQFDVDLFPTLYPNCTEIGGTVTISGVDITNLDSLYSIEIVSGDLRVSSTNLNDFSGLNSLDSIHGTFYVGSNAMLQNFIGMENLTFIGDYFTVLQNQSLIDFFGLDNLNKVVDEVSIEYNNSLRNFVGLDDLNQINSSFRVSENDSLENFLGLASLQSIGHSFDINRNAHLSSFDGLDLLNSISSLQIWSNPSLIDLSSLIALTDVYLISISENGMLQTLHGLDSIQAPGHSIRIRDNNLLSDISALENMAFANSLSLYIQDNPLLSTCSYSSICSHLDQGGNTTIANNDSGCNGANEINNACCIMDTTYCPEPSLTCLPNGITFNSQLEVDLFPLIYPGCRHIGGTVKITGTGINNIDSLASIEIIDGDLRISSTSLINTTGLNALDSIHGTFYVGSNAMLQNFIGMENLTFIGDYFTVLQNQSLIDFFGLANLNKVMDEVSIEYNNSLRNFVGLDDLNQINSSFRVSENDSLENFLGLASLQSIGHSFDINRNAHLSSFDGLDLLNSISSLQIWSNPSLIDLSSLIALTDVYLISISENGMLQTLHGLDSIQAPGHSIRIRDNNLLSDISALENMAFANSLSLYIQDNPLLSICSYSSICSHLNQGGNTTIVNNDSGCNGTNEINIACCIMDTAYCPEPSLTCLPNGITFNSQVEVDLFPLIYPACRHIGGTVKISGTGINNIDSLASIEVIDGDLRISSTSLVNTTGLNALDSIHGTFYVGSNAMLQNFVGMENLTFIGDYFTVLQNQSLTDFFGLANLTDVMDEVRIEYNNSLRNFVGLEDLNQINSSFRVSENDSLENFLGLANLQSIGHSFDINRNAYLTSFDGLDLLNSISSLQIWSNPVLTDLSSLIAMTDVYLISISENGMLQTLHGLDSIQAPGHSIRIRDNNLLSDISALENMAFANSLSLYIQDNPLLSTCSYSSICSHLNQGGNTTIANNDVGCDGVAEVILDCDDLLYVFKEPQGFWHAPLNWSTSLVPDSTSYVIVASGNDCEIQPDTTADCNYIFVQPGATFFIPHSSVLNVHGN